MVLQDYVLREFDEYDDYVNVNSQYYLNENLINGEKFIEFLELLFIDGNEKIRKQAQEMSLCRKKSFYLNNGTYQFSIDATCGNRMCPHCSKRRSQRHNKALRKHFSKVHKDTAIKNIRFLTLTYRNVKTREELNNIMKSISKDMIKFRRTLSRMGYEILSGYRVVEVTWSEETGFHPHIHLLYFSKLKNTSKCEDVFNNFVKKHKIRLRYSERLKKHYKLSFFNAFHIWDRRSRKNVADGFIDYEFLKSVWAFSNHQGAFVSKPVKINYGMNAGINYICKYMTKGFYDDKIPISKVVDIYIATQSTRFIQKFGKTFNGYKVSLYKVVMFYKDDVDIVGLTERGKPIYQAKEDARSFGFGFSPHLDFISKVDIRYIEV